MSYNYSSVYVFTVLQQSLNIDNAIFPLLHCSIFNLDLNRKLT